MSDRKELSGPDDAEREVDYAMQNARASGKWMAVVWRIDADGEMHLNRISLDFPCGARRLQEAYAMLTESLNAEVEATKPKPIPGPLPRPFGIVTPGGENENHSESNQVVAKPPTSSGNTSQPPCNLPSQTERKGVAQTREAARANANRLGKECCEIPERDDGCDKQIQRLGIGEPLVAGRVQGSRNDDQCTKRGEPDAHRTVEGGDGKLSSCPSESE